MKILFKNHKKNYEDKIKEEEKREYEEHTVECPECHAKFHFSNDYVKIYSTYDKEDSLKADVSCPCCNTTIHLSSEFALKVLREADGRKPFNAKFEILKEGNFSMKTICENCESELQLDYRDCKYEKPYVEKRIGFPIGDKSIESAWTTICPVCGEKFVVKKD